MLDTNEGLIIRVGEDEADGIHHGNREGCRARQASTAEEGIGFGGKHFQ